MPCKDSLLFFSGPGGSAHGSFRKPSFPTMQPWSRAPSSHHYLCLKKVLAVITNIRHHVAVMLWMAFPLSIGMHFSGLSHFSPNSALYELDRDKDIAQICCIYSKYCGHANQQTRGIKFTEF